MSCSYSGRKVDLLNIKPDQIDIADIAISLARMPRWAGHTKPHKYSVAEHSVYVSRLVPEVLALPALMHDCEEAFTGDIPTPVKLITPGLEATSMKIRLSIWAAFGISATEEDWEIIRHADRTALQVEARDLMPHKWLQAEVGKPPAGIAKIRVVVEEQAVTDFLLRFAEAMVIWRKRKVAA